MGMPGPQMVDRYGVEFKLIAFKMSESPGVLIKDVADSLSSHPFMLSKWRKQVREGVVLAFGYRSDAVVVGVTHSSSRVSLSVGQLGHTR